MTGLFTARQVADMLGVSAETVLRWTRRGELPALRLPGGAIRFREDAMDDWLIRTSGTSRSGSGFAADFVSGTRVSCAVFKSGSIALWERVVPLCRFRRG